MIARFFAGIATALLLAGSLRADPAPQPQLVFTPGTAGTWNTEWAGVAHRVYFVQWSLDLETWNMAPFMEFGTGVKSTGIDVQGAERFFVRLSYYDDPALQTLAQAEAADPDTDGLSNKTEVEEQGTYPLLIDTDDDGTGDGVEALAGTSGTDAGSGGTPVKVTLHSHWIESKVWNMVVGSGTHATFGYDHSGEDSTLDGWILEQPQYPQLLGINYGQVSQQATVFPLPQWQDRLDGAWWRNIEETRPAPPNPYTEWTASQLEHRLELNRKAPRTGYEYRLQVLELHWTRAAAAGSPWTADTGNSSIIKKLFVMPGETLSDPVTYNPIPALAANKAISRVAVHFEEMEPESGFDDGCRYDPSVRFDLPWLVVANSVTAATAPKAQVKLNFSPGDQELHLAVTVDGGYSATVTPNTISGDEPVTLTIEGSGPSPNASLTGNLTIEGVPVLQLAFYRRREVTLAVHAIALTNDDVEATYVKVDGQPAVPIPVGQGKPNVLCIKKGSGVFQTQQRGGDDEFRPVGPGITTGRNGICETTAAAGDVQVIPKGQGDPDAVIITAGPNNELNTAPNKPNANIFWKPTGAIINPEDDVVSGTTITTGPDGIRQTPPPTPRRAPANVPTQAQLQAYLDRTFGPQTNIWFNIVGWHTADCAFDVASTLPGDADFPVMKSPNYHFDFYSSEKDAGNDPLKTREEQLVEAASFDSGATFNLYYIAAPLHQNYRINSSKITESPEGFARSDLRRPYIAAYELININNQTPTFTLVGAAAHELAHNDLIDANTTQGLSHPWDNVEQNGPDTEAGFRPYFPVRNHTLIDQQMDRRRLMWGFYPLVPNPDTGRYPGLLLKHEADLLHEPDQP